MSRQQNAHCAESHKNANSDVCSPLLMMAVPQNSHPGNHCEQCGYFISESCEKPQSRNYLCLSAFLLLHDGCLMSTWTCGNTYCRSFSTGLSCIFFSFHFMEFKAPGFTKHYENVNLCIIIMSCLQRYCISSIVLESGRLHHPNRNSRQFNAVNILINLTNIFNLISLSSFIMTWQH